MAAAAASSPPRSVEEAYAIAARRTDNEERSRLWGGASDKTRFVRFYGEARANDDVYAEIEAVVLYYTRYRKEEEEEDPDAVGDIITHIGAYGADAAAAIARDIFPLLSKELQDAIIEQADEFADPGEWDMEDDPDGGADQREYEDRQALVAALRAERGKRQPAPASYTREELSDTETEDEDQPVRYTAKQGRDGIEIELEESSDEKEEPNDGGEDIGSEDTESEAEETEEEDDTVPYTEEELRTKKLDLATAPLSVYFDGFLDHVHGEDYLPHLVEVERAARARGDWYESDTDEDAPPKRRKKRARTALEEQLGSSVPAVTQATVSAIDVQMAVRPTPELPVPDLPPQLKMEEEDAEAMLDDLSLAMSDDDATESDEDRPIVPASSSAAAAAAASAPPKKKYHKWTAEEDEKLVLRVSAGATFKQVAAELGLTATKCRGRYKRLMKDYSQHEEEVQQPLSYQEFIAKYPIIGTGPGPEASLETRKRWLGIREAFRVAQEGRPSLHAAAAQ